MALEQIIVKEIKNIGKMQIFLLPKRFELLISLFQSKILTQKRMRLSERSEYEQRPSLKV